MENEKGLNKKEKFVCEITWGNVPTDVKWVRSSKLFIGKMKEFDEGKYKDLWKLENKSVSG